MLLKEQSAFTKPSPNFGKEFKVMRGIYLSVLVPGSNRDIGAQEKAQICEITDASLYQSRQQDHDGKS